MMHQAPDLVRWLVVHAAALVPFRRPREHVRDLDASQRAVTRAERVIERWNQRVADGQALQNERRFWQHVDQQNQEPDDG